MDPDSVKSTLQNLAFGNVMAAAARNYQKELLSNEKAAATSSANQEVDLDELMDDPELEKLHADRINALKKEAEKREALKRKGHGEYRDITEGDFLGEVTGTEKVICHFYHREFYRCKIMDKHLKTLALKHVDSKFIKLDAEFVKGLELGIEDLMMNCRMRRSSSPSWESKLYLVSYSSEKELLWIGWLDFKKWEREMISAQGRSRLH
ncbi:thioredoxin domain-containing protein PLP3A-like isoform X2 [Pyrus communis]|uniref:thioredoxin domain-containing protein PLP3A-like isoform X2 n=1 Tax=Pyrus communis TaxID=23211 RepID=UPI0035BFFC05